MIFLVARACPNCGGIISDDRLLKGLPCRSCLPEPKEDVCKELEESGRLKNLLNFCKVESEFKRFVEFFKKALGYPPLPIQETWIKRLLFRESFAIVAPTGTGKTTFGLISALSFDSQKVLILVPTRLLVQQTEERLKEFCKKAGISRNILAYLGRKKEKEDFNQKNFDILVATVNFFYRNLEKLNEINFSFIFIDDVDSFLKRSSHIDSLFKLLGFSEEEIALALKHDKKEEDFEKLEEIRKRHSGKKILLLSSATLKPRGNRVMLFRFLLGFDIYQAVSNLRNVIDITDETYPEIDKACKRIASLLKILGKGGLLFVSSIFGKNGVEEVVKNLRKEGFKVLSYLELDPETLMEEMKRGEFDIAVGLSHIGNPLVRGIDLPYVLRYAIFLGVPKHVFPTKVSAVPRSLYNILVNVISILEDEERIRRFQDIQYLKKYLNLKEEDLERYPRIKQKCEKIKEFIEKKFKEKEFIERLENSEDVFLIRQDGEIYLVVGDSATYLQASGRVSRLTASGLLKGLSIVIPEDKRSLKSLTKRLKLHLGEEFSFRHISEIDLSAISEELTRIRKERKIDVSNQISTALVIVESPNKARTIASFFGKPTVRKVGDAFVYEIPTEERILMITASLGHVFNLSRKKGFFGVFKEDSYFIPVFDTIKIVKSTGQQLVDPEEVEQKKEKGPIFDKQDLIKSFQRLAYEIKEVFIGSDPDAEGEKIAYDLFIQLSPFNKNINRLEFHEVTPRAFREALKNPVRFNLNRVKAQLARRVVDRWVGFTLSQRLWKEFKKTRLSAGRVQTPVLGWVIERAEEAKKKKAKISFRLWKYLFSVELEDTALAKNLFQEIKQGKLSVSFIEEKEQIKIPPPPYTTDTILQDASQRLGLSTNQTMKLLQELFESGLITYHRTDSTRISEVGRYQVAKRYIADKFGEELFYPREWAEEGAHEGIRPTRPQDESQVRFMIGAGFISLSDPNISVRLYDLIFRRFIASQMRQTKLKVKRLRFETPSYSWEDEAIFEILEEGFEKVFPTFSVASISEEIKVENVSFRLVPKADLYTEGTLVQEMKKRGLGRPSTYAEIVTTLINRNYIKVLPNGRLYPTRLGREVYKYLKQNFPRYIDESLTRQLEEAMDMIEEGNLDYQEVLRKAYEARNYIKEEEFMEYPEESLISYQEKWSEASPD